MPDDSSGIYSVPAGTIVSTGDTILPSQHNPWANDSASAISARFSKDGRAPATGNWNLNNFRITGLGAPVAGGDAVNKTYADATYTVNVQPSVDVASAATTDIGAAASQNVRVTGTTTITSFGTAPAGTFRRVRFAASLRLTYNATSLVLPSASNITTAADDVAELISEGSGNWRCVNYFKTSLVGVNRYAAVNATSGTSVDFTSIPSAAKRVTVLFSGVSTNGSSPVLLQLGSGSIQTTGYFGTGSVVAASAAASVGYTNGFGLGNAGDAAYTYSGTVFLSNITGNVWTASGTLSRLSGETVFVSGSVTLSGTLDRVRITTAGGVNAFDAGTINVMWEG